MDLSEIRSLQESYFASVRGSHLDSSAYIEPQSLSVSISEQSINCIVENAMARVFYGGGDDLHEVETKETREGTKYKVRVKDRQSGSSYIRFASREKIAELRANPNIASVELTDETPSNATADGTSAKTQTFGGGVNQNRSSGAGYQRPVKPMSQRPDMAARMAARDNKALS